MADEEALKGLRELLEHVRERVEYAISRLRAFEEVRCLRWKCAGCGYLKHFTKPMPSHVAVPCPRCRGATFEPQL